MLSIWWDQQRMNYRQLFPDNIAIPLSIENMVNQYLLIRPESDRILLLHDNGCPQTALKTRKQNCDLDVEVLPHPMYSSDLAAMDYLCSILLKTIFGERCSTTEDTSKPTWMASSMVSPQNFTLKASSSCPHVGSMW
uniref:Uncharacterized protein n=1 Tax=Caenorhabditis japonica TaxID=281687 RepID=A0A8R1I4M4_CAEJA